MNASVTPSAETGPQSNGQQMAVVGLISAGHFISHFYVICLAPLYIAMSTDLGVGFAELGLISSGFFLASATLQMPAGLLVDRIGAKRVLFVGMFVLSVSITLAGLTESYWALLVLFMVAGAGNCVFHPCDYVILSSSISEDRLGRAFSIHSFSGSAGFFVAPIVLPFLEGATDWRTALFISGIGGLVIAGTILLLQGVMRDSVSRKKKEPGQLRRTKNALFSRRILSHFVYFITSSAATSALSGLTIVVLVAHYGVSKELAGIILTSYLIAASVGVIGGGIIADKTKRHDMVLIVTMLIATVATAIAALGTIPFWMCALMLLVAGVTKGVVAPSRDLMVRNDAPPALLGGVVAFVTVGFTIGNGAAPAIAGWLVDIGSPLNVFWFAAAMALASIACVLVARRDAPGPVDQK
ncbi:MAG: MFS transporter [Alphaproteobacteria bacterium]|nr:MFS transporter [Alphaproteobacteria bacterium]